MYGLRNSFKKISEEIQIPFKLIDKDGNILADFLSGINIKKISCPITIPAEELTLETYENYSNCIGLLKCFLEQELVNTVKSKGEIILDILKGKEFSDDVLKEVIKYKPFKLILVYLNEKQLKKGLEIIRNNPLEEDSIIVTQDEYILIISKNEISKEKINELFNLINKNITKEVYMTYCNINKYKELKEKFEYLKRKYSNLHKI